MAAPTEEQIWDERYASRPALWSGEPNVNLVAEVETLPPGAALDVGCGEGGDAIWLAGKGWTVTAADISSVALARAREHARLSGASVAERITWVHANLAEWEPPRSTFHLVSAQYVHLREPLRQPVLRRLAAAVAPGGMLLVVGHDVTDLETPVPRPPDPQLYLAPGELAALLGGESWQVVRDAVVRRDVTGPAGETVAVGDAVFRARRVR